MASVISRNLNISTDVSVGSVPQSHSYSSQPVSNKIQEINTGVVFPLITSWLLWSCVGDI